ncbi:MAG TPA: lytic transglycosylase domain-containing protein [Flavobacteriales bacterium]|nr:lytic transglycosylase domain-containing protein [Flavobacteriales bacterium]
MRTALRTLTWTLLLLGGSALVQLFAFGTTDEGSDLDHLRDFNEGYKVFSLTLPDELSFCGETVPMDRIDVRERLDRELLVNTYWQSNTLLVHKRAHRWFPLIEQVLKREGVPDDMKYLALIESGLTNAISPVGATGFWQFMRETGIHHQLEITGEVDERYHVEKSTVAACKYLKAAHNRYGS